MIHNITQGLKCYFGINYTIVKRKPLIFMFSILIPLFPWLLRFRYDCISYLYKEGWVFSTLIIHCYSICIDGFKIKRYPIKFSIHDIPVGKQNTVMKRRDYVNSFNRRELL